MSEEKNIDNYKNFEEKAEEVYLKYKDEEPEIWGKSIGFFASPLIFLIISIIYLVVQSSSGLFTIFNILILNFVFIMYRVLLYSNQSIKIYSTKLVYEYGLFKTYEKIFYYGTDDINAVKSGEKDNILKKTFNYSTFYLINQKGLGYSINYVNNADDLLDTITDKVVNFQKEFDPNYEREAVEIITKNGIMVQTLDENGEYIFITKEEYNKNKKSKSKNKEE